MVNVIKGPAAFSFKTRYGTFWWGVASGNRHAGKNRRTAKRALQDARRLSKRREPAPF